MVHPSELDPSKAEAFQHESKELSGVEVEWPIALLPDQAPNDRRKLPQIIAGNKLTG